MPKTSVRGIIAGDNCAGELAAGASHKRVGGELLGNVVKDGGDGGGVGVGRCERVAVLVDELHKQQIRLRVPRGRRRHHLDERMISCFKVARSSVGVW
jgi:hypothetical protein